MSKRTKVSIFSFLFFDGWSLLAVGLVLWWKTQPTSSNIPRVGGFQREAILFILNFFKSLLREYMTDGWWYALLERLFPTQGTREDCTQAKRHWYLPYFLGLDYIARLVAQTVKEVLDSLVADNLVICEKIGTSNYFWAFPSAALVAVGQPWRGEWTQMCSDKNKSVTWQRNEIVWRISWKRSSSVSVLLVLVEKRRLVY